MSISRNDPCPCGSGRKYKKCHLIQEESERARKSLRSPLHDLDNSFVDRVTIWAADRFGVEMEKASQELDFLNQQPGGLELLIPWTIYHRPIRELPPFEWYLRAHGPDLPPREREWADAQRMAWLGVWEVQERMPGRSMTLTDRLTGERRLVRETSASRIVVAHDTLLCRVVDLGADSVICGMHPRYLPARAVSALLDELRGSTMGELPVMPERLRNPDIVRELIEVWQDAVDDHDRRRSATP